MSVELQAGEHLVVPITMTQKISVYVMDGATYSTWNQRGICAPPSAVIKAASNIAGQYRVDLVAPKSGTYYIVLLNYNTAQGAGFATISIDLRNLITTNTITNSAVQYSMYSVTEVISSLQTEQMGQTPFLFAIALIVTVIVALAVLMRRKGTKKRRV